MAPRRKPTRLLDVRGRPLIERRGIKRTSLADDAYHLLRTASWTQILFLFAGLFAISNVAFAAVLYFGRAAVTNAHRFLDYVWFSVQTMGTIGFGYLAPNDNLANVVVALESFYSIILTALVTGTFFARFSTPSARVIFSKVAIIASHEGQRVLQFRMANGRTTAIVEATARLYMVREERLSTGDVLRRVHDLHLRRSTSPVFALSFLAIHVIDETSPLFGMTAEDLRATGATIVVTFTGIDDRLATNVHSRYVWNADDVVYDRKFVDLFNVDPVTGVRYVDLAPMHDTVPLAASEQPLQVTSPEAPRVRSPDAPLATSPEPDALVTSPEPAPVTSADSPLG